MAPYILRRLLQSIIVLLGVSTLVFMLMHLTGDPVPLLLPPYASQEQIDQLRHQLGLDQPLVVQYVRFLKNLAQGRFPESITYNQSPITLIMERLPATITLGGLAILGACLIGFPTGLLAAWYRRSWFSSVAMGLAIIGYSMPVYWVGLLLMTLFSVKLQWLPASGAGTPWHYIMPAVALGSQIGALVSRLVWSTTLDQMGEDYIRTAMSKGLSTSAVRWKHGLKNSLIPVVTVLGLEAAGVMGNAVLTETVFAWPGVARLTVQAIFHRDYPLVQATVLFMALAFVLVNVVVDLIYVYLDPRIRYTS